LQVRAKGIETWFDVLDGSDVLEYLDKWNKTEILDAVTAFDVETLSVNESCSTDEDGQTGASSDELVIGGSWRRIN
jgi:hypothetical protein